MLSHGHGFFDEEVQIFGDFRCQSLSFEDSQHFASGDAVDLCDSMGITQHHSDLGRCQSFLGQLADLFHHLRLRRGCCRQLRFLLVHFRVYFGRMWFLGISFDVTERCAWVRSSLRRPSSTCFFFSSFSFRSCVSCVGWRVVLSIRSHLLRRGFQPAGCGLLVGQGTSADALSARVHATHGAATKTSTTTMDSTRRRSHHPPKPQSNSNLGQTHSIPLKPLSNPIDPSQTSLKPRSNSGSPWPCPSGWVKPTPRPIPKHRSSLSFPHEATPATA